MFPVSDAIGSEQIDSEEAEGKIKRRESGIDAYSGPAILARQLSHSLRD